jgi:hypothetical protein
MILAIGWVSLSILGSLILHWSARHKIHQFFERRGSSISRIRRFNGFLGLGSILEAATSEAYYVTIMAQDRHESKLLCLVRYIPVVGIARSVEVLSNVSDHA